MMREDMQGLAIVAALVVVGAWSFYYLLAVRPAERCEATAKVMSVRHTWTFSTGCMVEYRPGKWVPLSALRVVDGQQ